ncbi:MAG: hypothetical protein Q9180_007759, partial [Flavoplaca navasiana]
TLYFLTRTIFALSFLEGHSNPPSISSRWFKETSSHTKGYNHKETEGAMYDKEGVAAFVKRLWKEDASYEADISLYQWAEDADTPAEVYYTGQPNGTKTNEEDNDGCAEDSDG